MTLCEMDVRPGGAFRWGWKVPSGLMAMSGRFLELKPPGLIVHTELFDEDWTDGETKVTTRLLEEGAGTRMDMEVLYRTPKGRDMVLATRMAQGMEEGYVKLDAFVLETAP
jgi:uncharacterized protein YndB with AHSA1/START domain